MKNKQSNKKEQECNDRKCPFHGELKLRGKKLEGTVTKSKSTHTAIIELTKTKFVQKYERYEKRRKTLAVHNPECIHAETGDFVIISECRPISKTKSFVITKKMGENIDYKLKKERIESDKETTKEKKKETEEPNEETEKEQKADEVENASD